MTTPTEARQSASMSFGQSRSPLISSTALPEKTCRGVTHSSCRGGSGDTVGNAGVARIPGMTFRMSGRRQWEPRVDVVQAVDDAAERGTRLRPKLCRFSAGRVRVVECGKAGAARRPCFGLRAFDRITYDRNTPHIRSQSKLGSRSARRYKKCHGRGRKR